MTEPRVEKCRFCGRLYEVASHMVGDQSCCPSCRYEAHKNTHGQYFSPEWRSKR